MLVHKRFAKYAVLIAIASVLLVPPMTLSSYATHRSDNVVWQMVFLSSYSGCSNYQYQMLNRYHGIAQNYFELYQFENEDHKPVCIPEKNYANYTFQADTDLLILIYDRNIGRKDLNSQGLGGLYTHIGNDITKNHVIIFCDCPDFYFSQPVWILTHELSHYILSEKGFPPEIAEDKIHAVDAKYDQCMENRFVDESCQEIETKLNDGFTMYKFSVMPPYVPAIGTNYSDTSNNSTVAFPMPEIQKEVTKWWALGKINDTDYTTFLRYFDKRIIIENQTQPNFMADRAKIILADGPKGDDYQKALQINPTEWPAEKISKLLARIPSLLTTDSQAEINGENVDLQWLKTRAQWWMQNQISDEEFFQGYEYLIKSGTINSK